MKKKSILFSPVILMFLASSCERSHTEYIDIMSYEPLGNIPVIEFENISTTDVVEYQDTIIFTIFYQDGNGDIGTLDPDASTIELIDNRDSVNLIFNYHLSPRSPAGSEIAIQGTLDVVLEHSIILDDNNASEETTFSLRIKDEAGNWSNRVDSPTVVVHGD
jgi:hypothetical protein